MSNVKQLTVFDKSGNNSAAVRIGSGDATLLANQTAEGYELIINSEMSEETANDGLRSVIEESESIDF